ncbi:regulator of protease activity HflC (stomatin/prohibitin superfamily) [Nocardioides salarius]|uniref:Regulator of protease activity HflC (Stomatin/prohibitin superfamily) n=1 Tax=Nocardioides salarius TaxID=374513 RepID=A0ABS2MCD9_9ACTN|nr:hypothetical protein [Nocardioides salarius]MBM7508871.1 regulator of protease activity HflC (stomatin/prohibitin superfamily) [Nocardioides salarius]
METTTAVSPPPSLDDILAAARSARIGRVDFTHRLAPEAPPEPQPEPQPEPRSEAPPEPAADAEPPAEQDAAPEPEPEPDPEPGPEPEPDPEPVVVPPDALETMLAHLPRLAPVPDPDRRTAPEPVLHVDVAEVARVAVQRIEAARAATLAHLAAVEEEVARRCELITAQAELDAELLRLQARREAHSIVTAARARTGPAEPDDEGARLAAIADVVARLGADLDLGGPPPPGGER